LLFSGLSGAFGQNLPRVSAANLAAARSGLVKQVGTPSFPLYLEAYALVLGTQDALTLLGEYIPKAEQQKKPGLYKLAGDLAYVAGIFPVAASNYTMASQAFPELGMKAALCHLLAGESQKALSLLDSHPDTIGTKSLVEEKNLLKAWISYESKDPKRAVSLLLPLARQGNSDALARKALYILWIIGTALGEGGGGGDSEVLPKEYSPQAVKALLASRYPGSVESALVDGLAIPRPSVLLFAGFGQEINSVPSPQPPESTSLALPLASLPESDPPAFSRLQVGLFSRRENAVALSAKLLEHGFSASTEERPVQGENVSRWAVIVVTAKDWAATVAQLKDLGYETYLLP
jgi:hypothetical protein